MASPVNGAPGTGELRGEGGPGRTRRLPAAMDPLLIGLLGAGVSLAGAARPSFWYDEAATISAAYSRSLGQLWQMLANVDAVHGLYYLLMHGWFQVFPPTEFWSRAPSGLAVGAAAAGVVVLGRQLSSRGVGLAAGVVCAILPRSTWAGIEARPYALSMMAAVWLSVLLVHATRRGGSWIWMSYGILLGLSVLLDVYLVLLSLVHAVFVLVFERRRAVLLGFGITSAAVLLVLAPFVAVVVGQVSQVAWIPPIGRRAVEDVLIQQYFDKSPPFAVLAALVLAGAVVMWLFTSRKLAGGDRELLVLSAAWVVVPTGLIVLRSTFAEPIYTPRYLCFTVPAIALVLGLCIATLARWPWTTTGLLALFAIAAAPNYALVQRAVYAKWEMDYSPVADLITAKAAPGDCLLVNDTVTFHPAPMRPLLAARPDAYRKLIDISLWQRAADGGAVFDTNLIPEVVVGPLSQCSDLWIITQADGSRPNHETGAPLEPGPQFGNTSAFRVPNGMGFQLSERWQFNLVQVIMATRLAG